MAKGNGGSMGRIVVLVVVLLLAGGAFWYFKYGPGVASGGGLEETVINGTLTGKTLEDANKAFGVQPVEQPNPDAATSTAKIYLYTIPGARPERQFIKVRVAANGAINYTRFVDQAGNEIVVDTQR